MESNPDFTIISIFFFETNLFNDNTVWSKTAIEQLEEHRRFIAIKPYAEENAHEEQQNFPYRYETVRVIACES